MVKLCIPPRKRHNSDPGGGQPPLTLVTRLVHIFPLGAGPEKATDYDQIRLKSRLNCFVRVGAYNLKPDLALSEQSSSGCSIKMYSPPLILVNFYEV